MQSGIVELDEELFDEDISSNSFSTAHEKEFSVIQSLTSNKIISFSTLLISNCLLSILYVKITLLSKYKKVPIISS